MKFCILGGGGCFGINAALFLLASGHEVIGCGRSPLRGPVFAFDAAAKGYRYRALQVGLDNEFIAEWLNVEQPDVIINFAAQGEGAASYRALHWKYFYRTNVDALVELTELLMGKPWLKRFIQVGTSEVYGSVTEPATELAPVRPSSPYAVSKLAFDMHLVSIAKTWGFPAVICRPSNCLCAGQQLHRVVPKVFLHALTGRRMPLHGGGAARKSYMDANDLSHALLFLAEHGVTGEIYNAGPADTTSIRDLVALCAGTMNKTLADVVDEVPDRTGQDGCYWIDSAKLRALGWDNWTPLETGIKRVGNWVGRNLDVLAAMPTDYEMRA